MNCKELLRLLPDYLDREMQREICLELELHVLECPYCRSHVQTMQETVALASELAIPAVHHAWVAGLRERVLRAKPPEPDPEPDPDSAG